MSLYNTKKVKELPQLEEIIEGNYLIVENETGTNIIDFADFVIGDRKSVV
jgi:pantothenate kinase